MPDPLYDIPSHYPRRLATTFEQLVAQTESKFSPYLASDGRWTGKNFVFRDISKNTWSRNEARGGLTTSRETAASFRSVFKKKVEGEAIEFPEWDAEYLDYVATPQSAEMQALNAGYQRALDDLTLESFFEDAFGGPEPHNTAIPFPVSQIIPVNYGTPVAPVAGSDQPLTPWKIIRGKKLLQENDFDLDREELILAITPTAVEDLTYYASTVQNEPWAKIVGSWLQEYHNGNKMAKLMGCTPIITNRISATSGFRNYALFVKSSIVRSAAFDFKMSMDRLPRERNKGLLQASAWVGIGRRRDEGIVKLPCYNA